MACERTSQHGFFGVTALLFAVSTTTTILWCRSMPAMGGMEMPGGWTMSMTWMPGQSWPVATASFLAMWSVMMVAMMLPSLLPMLLRYRYAVSGRGEQSLGRLTTLVGAGYFFVWTMLGLIMFPLGVELASLEMQKPEVARAIPSWVGIVVLIAGLLQFTQWKARHLACCRETPDCDWTMAADFGTAWRHGLRLGMHCVYSCAGLTAILLVIGVMDLRAMALVGAAITAERLAPSGVRVARIIGVVVILAGLILVAGSRARLIRDSPPYALVFFHHHRIALHPLPNDFADPDEDADHHHDSCDLESHGQRGVDLRDRRLIFLDIAARGRQDHVFIRAQNQNAEEDRNQRLCRDAEERTNST